MCNFCGQNGKKMEKKFFTEKKMNSLEWLQNLMQDSTLIGAFCGKQGQHL